MAVSIRNFIKRSIFLRLLIIFLFTALILFVLVGGLANYLSDPSRLIHQKFQYNIEQYATFLIEKISTPPNYKIAQSFSDDLGLDIKISNKKQSWQSLGYHLPASALEKGHQMSSSSEMKIGHYRGYSYVILNHTSYEYIFVLSHRRFVESKGVFLISLVFIVFIVITFCYYMVRWLFRPLAFLGEGVKQVSEGNFDFRVSNKRQDELGELAEGFNQMSEKIQLMMKEKEQLLLDVSHELRSPITRAKLALELIDDEKSKTNVQEDLREMESMISELLESARLNNPNSSLVRQNIPLTPLIETLQNNYASTTPGVSFIAPDKEVLLNADVNRLQICLRNIIENGLKYSKHQNKPIEIQVQELADKIQIEITDFGIGVPKIDQQHIFEPFYRVDKSRNSKTGGYGLGLSLCKKIVNAHGGNILLNSDENKKTCFTLIFPKI